MSKARKIKKDNRYFEWELHHSDGWVTWYGSPDEADARRERMRSKRQHGMRSWRMGPVPVKRRR